MKIAKSVKNREAFMTNKILRGGYSLNVVPKMHLTKVGCGV
nr:MAG TPA: hypothetical protein [Caudoviricetes sp.]